VSSRGGATLVRDFVLRNQYGMHARPAALFVKAASKYDSEVFVEKGDTRVSGKSILGLMTLEASCQSTIRVTVSGADATELLAELADLIDRKFDED
jgi:phosphocarrier protein